MMLGVCLPVHRDQWHPGGVWETESSFASGWARYHVEKGQRNAVS